MALIDVLRIPMKLKFQTTEIDFGNTLSTSILLSLEMSIFSIFFGNGPQIIKAA